jgi:hypothetical protein
MKLDCTKLTWMEMSKIVLSIHKEMKRRNPIGVNFYAGHVKCAADLLEEIAGGEAYNFSSECGPKEPRIRKKNAA